MISTALTARSVRAGGAIASLVLSLAFAGCGGGPGNITPGAGSSFDDAGRLILSDTEPTEITGTISSADPAVYDLGAVEPGDRIIITVDPTMTSTLDPVIAIFDENQELLAINDDVDLASGQVGSAIDQIIFKATGHLYLGIARFFFDTAGGDYEGTVQIEHGVTIPTPPTQTLLLNFDGGQIFIASEGSINVPVFDAADIDPAYSGRTASIKSSIISIVRDRFKDTGVDVVVSDNNPVLPSEYSTIHFGSFSSTKFGVSEAVDQGNQDLGDIAIVFTEDFDNPFATQPSYSGIAVAIGQVAVHEAGHLLGLNHTADVTDIMDTTGSASTLLAKQVFKTAVLSNTIFPIGKQNGPALLENVVPE